MKDSSGGGVIKPAGEEMTEPGGEEVGHGQVGWPWLPLVTAILMLAAALLTVLGSLLPMLH